PPKPATSPPSSPPSNNPVQHGEQDVPGLRQTESNRARRRAVLCAARIAAPARAESIPSPFLPLFP
ncbi:MAG: hypothetical protein K1W02_08965, partial [Muribaculaceae bacterium]